MRICAKAKKLGGCVSYVTATLYIDGYDGRLRVGWSDWYNSGHTCSLSAYSGYSLVITAAIRLQCTMVRSSQAERWRRERGGNFYYIPLYLSHPRVPVVDLPSNPYFRCTLMLNWCHYKYSNTFVYGPHHDSGFFALVSGVNIILLCEYLHTSFFAKPNSEAKANSSDN